MKNNKIPYEKQIPVMLCFFVMVFALIILLVSHSEIIAYICIALIGFGYSNIFPIFLSQALLALPDKKNEVSGLMIMRLFGGTIFPLAMGLASDAAEQGGAVAVTEAGAIYLLIYTLKLKK